MSDTRSITDDNIDLFLGRLERADNDADRALFRKLLIAETDRYAAAQHLRDKLFRCISVSNEQVRDQATRLAELRARGEDTTQAEDRMRSLALVHDTLVSISGTLRSD